MLKFNFTTITPLNISNGETLDQNFNYTVFNGDLYKIDQTKFSKFLAANEKINFTENIETDKIEGWVKKHQIKIIDDLSSYSVKIHPSFQEHLNNQRAVGKRQVIEFINSNGNFYIPASSIKGALLTPYGLKSLGILPGDASRLQDKIVFYDSEKINSSNFSVYRTTNRPPQVNLICMDPDVTFSLLMRKNGLFDKDVFIGKLKSYMESQIKSLKKEVEKFKTSNSSEKADLFLRAVKQIDERIQNKEVVINIGFGGGSWFKIHEGKIPKFKSKRSLKKNVEEPAHTTHSFTINQELTHIGWCKLEIEEV